MELVKSNVKNCYNLSDFGDQSIVDWSGNNSTEIIKVLPYPQAPGLFYEEFGQDQYQWCGPLLLFVEYLARFLKLRIKLLRPQLVDEMISTVLSKGPEGMAQIYLVPLLGVHYYNYIVQMGAEDILRLSSIIDYGFPDQILAKTKVTDLTLLQKFKCFDTNIYTSILVSIVLISFFMSFYERSLKTFFRTFWSYSSVILSDYHSFRAKKSMERVLSGIWLMSCTLLLAAFSGQLREQILKPKSIEWIDSWEDLIKWEQMKIETFKTSSLIFYIDQLKKEEETTKILKERLVKLNDRNKFISFNTSFDKQLDYEGVRRGVTAFVHTADILEIIKQNLIKDDFKEDIDFHISESGGIPQPSYTITNRVSFNVTLAMKWDLIIDLFRESGIFDELLRKVLNPKNTPIFDKRVTTFTNDIENMTTTQMKELFFLLLISFVVSFVLLFFEYLLNIIFGFVLLN